MISFFFSVLLLRCVSFEREERPTNNTKEEELKVFCKYIYI